MESVSAYYPDALWQRCIVHWYRNIFSHVPSTKVRDVSLMLKAIHANESRAAALAKAADVQARLREMKLSKMADWVDDTIADTLSYYSFPNEHWRRIRTNNPLERIMREIRRRTRVVGAFPDGESALNLAAARLKHISGTKSSTKRYLNMNLLTQKNKQLKMKNHQTNQKCERFLTLSSAPPSRSNKAAFTGLDNAGPSSRTLM